MSGLRGFLRVFKLMQIGKKNKNKKNKKIKEKEKRPLHVSSEQ